MGPSSPFAFVKLSKDANLAKLTVISALQRTCDYTYEFDGIYLRTYVKLSPAQLGMYYSMHGATFLVGSAVSKVFQGWLGPWGYTNMVSATVFTTLCIKANARSFAWRDACTRLACLRWSSTRTASWTPAQWWSRHERPPMGESRSPSSG